MSHPVPHDDIDETMLKPRPRGRIFDLSSEPPSAPSTPPSEAQSFSPNLQAPNSITMDGSSTPARTRSILNLTSSTLFGIYEPTGYATDRQEPSTPFGTGAETPALGSRDGSFDFTRSKVSDSLLQEKANGHAKRRRSTITPMQKHHLPRRGFKGYFLPLAARLSALFAIGMLYGLLIGQLHDRQELAPVKVGGLNRQSWPYLIFWGVAAVALGEALPQVDKLWISEDEDDFEEPEEKRPDTRGSGDWLEVVRAIGAFVGIAFAIRRLPWQSTMQLSLTLALANPAVWYVVDRTPAGFLMSTAVALGGTVVLLSINPALVPSPSPAQVLYEHVARHRAIQNVTANAGMGEELVLGMFSLESIGVATWIASVLFVSSVCFGNIGRRLAPSRP